MNKNNCTDHQGNVLNIGDNIAFCRSNITYIGKVININDNQNPQIEYTFIDFRGKLCTYKYTPVHNNRYIRLGSV